MEKEFIPYEQALALKELGFENKTLKSYDTSVVLANGKYLLDNWYNVSSVDEVKAPLYQQAFRWFREKYGYYTDLFVDDDKTFGFMITYFVEIGRLDKPIQRKYSTYEEAELECLKKLIEIVKEK
jgi:hypothetical protein